MEARKAIQQQYMRWESYEKALEIFREAELRRQLISPERCRDLMLVRALRVWGLGFRVIGYQRISPKVLEITVEHRGATAHQHLTLVRVRFLKSYLCFSIEQ